MPATHVVLRPRVNTLSFGSRPGRRPDLDVSWLPSDQPGVYMAGWQSVPLSGSDGHRLVYDGWNGAIGRCQGGLARRGQ